MDEERKEALLLNASRVLGVMPALVMSLVLAVCFEPEPPAGESGDGVGLWAILVIPCWMLCTLLIQAILRPPRST